MPNTLKKMTRQGIKSESIDSVVDALMPLSTRPLVCTYLSKTE